MAVSTPDPMETALKKQVKDPYDLRRQQAQADTSEETDRQRDALRAQLTGQGVYDSGIRTAAEKDLDNRQSKALALREGAIDVEQGQAAERTSENALNRQMTSRGLDIQEKGVDQAGVLGNKGLDIQQQGVTQSGALANRGMDIQERGLSQAKALAERGLTIQETSLALQRQGMDKQEAQFYASMAHDTSESALNRTAAKDLQTGEQTFASGENALNRTSAKDLQTSAQIFAASQSELDRAAAVSLADLNYTHADSLAHLNSTLNKDYATFQDAINDINKTGDDKTKLQMLALAEKIAILKPGPEFNAQVDAIINGTSDTPKSAIPVTPSIPNYLAPGEQPAKDQAKTNAYNTVVANTNSAMAAAGQEDPTPVESGTVNISGQAEPAYYDKINHKTFYYDSSWKRVYV